MKIFLRYFLRFILLVLTIIIIWSAFNFSLIQYGIDQLKGQMHIVMNARNMKDVIDNTSVPDSIKQKIYFIEKVKKFAIDTIGLKPSKNYTTFYDQKDKPLLWVITASKPFEMKAYEWKFPLLGKVTYKGFFDYDKGKKEEELLKEQGFDTDYGEVSAWSTLGWFHDPILSGMLRRNKGQLAELIIHELTHSTLYLKSNVNLNENLASVCGEQGAKHFLSSTFGIDSKEFFEYINNKEDYNKFSRQMLIGAHLLDSLYKNINDSNTIFKQINKNLMIKAIVRSLDTITFNNPLRYKNLFSKTLPNNAYFIDFIRYDAQKDEMKKALLTKFKGNIQEYINFLRIEKDSLLSD